MTGIVGHLRRYRLNEEWYGRAMRELTRQEGHVQGVPHRPEYAQPVDLTKEQVVRLLLEHRTIRQAAKASGATFAQFQAFMSRHSIKAEEVRRNALRAAE